MKFDYIYIKEFVENCGYKLISTEYVSSQVPIKIECPNGHNIYPTFSEFKRKARCNECSLNKKPSLEYINTFLKEKGFELLSTVYVNNSSKLSVRCPSGHVWDINWINIKNGNGCPHCYGNAKIPQSKKKQVQGLTHPYTIEEVRHFYFQKGYELLSQEYINFKSKLDIKCDLNHMYSTTFAVSKKGFGCPECSGNKKYTLDDVKTYLQKYNYAYGGSEYKNKNSPIEVICPKGHLSTTKFGYFVNGQRCVSCGHQTSNAEQEVLSFVQKYFPNSKKVKFHQIVPNCPTLYKNKELDIFVPELNLAIEYCGLYWHSEASGEKPPKKHWNKLIYCRQNKIRLITIFEDEWLTRKEQVKNLLMSVMGVCEVKIGARKCHVEKIDNGIAKIFIDQNHIQPLLISNISFGLFYKRELVGIISGNKHHRQNQKGFVLQRLCFKRGWQIAGGASKLLQTLKNYAKQMGYQEMVSWSDNRISEGNVYKQIGFTQKIEYGQDYSYVLEGYYNKRHSKQGLKKTPEERLTGKKEYELRKEQGYYRIWDCGKKLWVLSI